MDQKWKKLLTAALGAAVLLIPVLRSTAAVALSALLLSAALNRPVKALEGWGVKRPWGAALLLLGLVGAGAALLFLSATQGCKSLLCVVELYDPFEGLEQRLAPLLNLLPAGLAEAAEAGLSGLMEEGNVLRERATAWAAEWAAGLMARLPGLLLALTVLLLAAFYALSDWERVKGDLAALLPRDWRGTVTDALLHLKSGAEGWLSVQGRMLLVQFVLLSAGLGLLREKGFLVKAALVALVDALPLLGCGAALIPWALFAFLGGESGKALGLLALCLVLWLCRTLLEPKLMGQRAGVSPVWTLLAVYLGARVFGFLGLIAAPIVLAAVAELVRSRRQEGADGKALDSKKGRGA